jgi:hypothetical protein
VVNHVDISYLDPQIAEDDAQDADSKYRALVAIGSLVSFSTFHHVTYHNERFLEHTSESLALPCCF